MDTLARLTVVRALYTPVPATPVLQVHVKCLSHSGSPLVKWAWNTCCCVLKLQMCGAQCANLSRGTYGLCSRFSNNQDRIRKSSLELHNLSNFAAKTSYVCKTYYSQFRFQLYHKQPPKKSSKAHVESLSLTNVGTEKETLIKRLLHNRGSLLTIQLLTQPQ